MPHRPPHRVTPSCRASPPPLVQHHEQWRQGHPGWRTLASLLRLCDGAGLLQAWPQALPALAALAADHDRDVMLRLELFQLLLALLDDDGKAAAWQQPVLGRQLVLELLEPGLVWRAGYVAAAVRLTVLSALAALLSRGRLPAELLVDLASGGTSGATGSGAAAALDGLLARVASCMDEDHEPDTRQLACHVTELLLRSGEL